MLTTDCKLNLVVTTDRQRLSIFMAKTFNFYVLEIAYVDAGLFLADAYLTLRESASL